MRKPETSHKTQDCTTQLLKACKFVSTLLVPASASLLEHFATDHIVLFFESVNYTDQWITLSIPPTNHRHFMYFIFHN